MSFVPVTSGEITTGEPVTSTTLNKIKDNFTDHEARISDLEAGGNIDYPPIILRVDGYYDTLGASTGLVKTVTNFPLKIVGARIYIDKAGTAGSTGCDIQVKRSGAAWESIFTTLPTVSYSAGDDAVSSDGIVKTGSTVELLAGDLIRLDTTAVQTNGRSFYIRIDYVKTEGE